LPQVRQRAPGNFIGGGAGATTSPDAAPPSAGRRRRPPGTPAIWVKPDFPEIEFPANSGTAGCKVRSLPAEATSNNPARASSASSCATRRSESASGM